MTTYRNRPAAAAFRDADSVRRGPLPAEVSMEPVVSGALFAREDVLLDEAGGFFAVWACDAGIYPRVKDKRGSFMYLLEGAGTIVDDEGTTHELTPDSVLILPFGWSGHWNITQTIRKVYVHTTPVPPFRTGTQPATFVSAPDLASGDQVIFDGPDGRCAVRTIAPGVQDLVNHSSARFTHVLAGEASVADAYMGMMAATGNERAARIPIDVEVWSERFPHLATAIELAGKAEGGRHDAYQTNRVTPWSDGRVVLIGDSAHAMCPALGQGASVGIVNAVELAHTLDSRDDISEALAVWEKRERAMTDAAQARSAYMAETRAMAKGNGFTPEVMETANFELSAAGPETLARYPVPPGARP